MEPAENTPSHTQNLNIISNVALVDVYTGTDNQESIPPAEADNILPPIPLHASENKRFLGLLFTNYMNPYDAELVN